MLLPYSLNTDELQTGPWSIGDLYPITSSANANQRHAKRKHNYHPQPSVTHHDIAFPLLFSALSRFLVDE